MTTPLLSASTQRSKKDPENRIIDLCNELIEAKAEAQRRNEEHRLELNNLRSLLLEEEFRWKAALERFDEESSSLELKRLYRNALHEAFGKQHIPKLVLNRQTELCQQMRLAATKEHQLLMHQKQVKELAKWLEREIDRLREEMGEMQIKYIQKIAPLRCEIEYHREIVDKENQPQQSSRKEDSHQKEVL